VQALVSFDACALLQSTFPKILSSRLELDLVWIYDTWSPRWLVTNLGCF
ncbi:3957_t:CDS:2, partial [Cetraspora pellucida]